MAGSIISSCRPFRAIREDGRRCTLLHWKDHAIHPADPAVKALRREYVTSRRRERLTIEAKGKYRSSSGVLYTSDDPAAPGREAGLPRWAA
jgi:hypothetical protein